MAISTMIICTACKQSKNVMHDPGRLAPSVCDSCRNEESENEKLEYLVELKELSMEERVRRLEEQAYDHKKVAHGYQSPPRF